MAGKFVDEDALKDYTRKIWSFKQGEMVSMMIHLGDRLGIYQALDGAGAVSAADLAEKTGYHSRWLLEWLKNQAAAEILEYHDGERFELTEVGSRVMAEDDSLQFAAGAFGGPTDPSVIDKLADAFNTGLGLSYEDLGPSSAHGTERMLGPWTKYGLPKIVPALPGLEDRLSGHAAIADVGCGAGLAIATLAELYPNSQCHGYDPSSHAIEIANRKITDRGLSNLEFHVAGGEELPTEPAYDFIITFDCMHDMTRPDTVIAAIRKAIKPDGIWLIKDIKSYGDFQIDRKNPFLAMMYGFSVTACMSSALSTADGLGLGTLGFHPEVVAEMTREGGFSQCIKHDFDDPSNFYYEVRI
jgi:2-polyprenyl-3-methyl-5-hydroxy-6-metoxy-1,4-benzoquinol methylase|tara:strand:+ start:1694 stop:2761 length:1068 start_codon:yes stop_codon:yes gene_type:complete